MKQPWGPPVSAEFGIQRKGPDIVREFKFKNSCGEVARFDIALLNNLRNEVNGFTQTLTSLCVKFKFKLLSFYFGLTQRSSQFVHHKEGIHDADGFLMDGSGVQLRDLQSEGGSYDSYIEFRSFVIESALTITSISERFIRKRKAKLSDTFVAPKLSRQAILDNNEKMELCEASGLEKSFKNSYIGFTNIPLANLSVHESLTEGVMPDRVSKIAESIMDRYDPSQVQLLLELRAIYYAL